MIEMRMRIGMKIQFGMPMIQMMVHLNSLRDAIIVCRLLLPASSTPPTLWGHSVDVVPRQLVDDRPLRVLREVHREVLADDLGVLLKTLQRISSLG